MTDPTDPPRAPDISNTDTPDGGSQCQVPAADGLELARSLGRATASSSPRAKRSKGLLRRDSQLSRVTGSHPDDRDPQLLDTTLGRLVQDHGWELDLRVHGLFGRWAELVGAEIADHATPESFADGKLVVRTDSTAWAVQLRLLASDVVRRLNLELGHGTVLALDVQGPQAPSRRGRLSTRDSRGPRDTYG